MRSRSGKGFLGGRETIDNLQLGSNLDAARFTQQFARRIMKSVVNPFIYWAASTILTAAAVVPVHGAEPAVSSELSAAADGNNAFALDLYGRLAAGKGNVFFSPYSISTCLAMTYAGARGETENQMAKILHVSTNQDGWHSSLGKLQQQLNDIQTNNNVELTIANGLWAQQDHPFVPAFVHLAERDYDAKLRQVNFRNSGPACREINDWAAEKTKGRIRDPVAPGMLNASSDLVLVNAIYFYGNWVRAFDPYTRKAPFYLADARVIQAPLMRNLSARVSYAEFPDLQILEMPYRGYSLSMVVLLPKGPNGFKKLEGTINSTNLAAWIDAERLQDVDVFLPKFKLEATYSLTPTLSAMGMCDAFDPNKADLSGIDGFRDLFVSAVEHRAYLDVNEEGTEAAAATAVSLMHGLDDRKTLPLFLADHPFVFLIRQIKSGAILFLGRLTEPAMG